jgi:hypothetical protein
LNWLYQGAMMSRALASVRPCAALGTTVASKIVAVAVKRVRTDMSDISPVGNANGPLVANQNKECENL